MTEEIITGLEIGSTKISVVIGSRSDEDQLEILGVGKKACTGVKKGNIVNIEKTAEAIQAAVEEAEIMAGVEIEEQDTIFVGISGTHTLGQNSNGICSISNANREITSKDVDRVVESAQTIKIPHERGIIHVLPLEFIVDDQRGVRDPIGMTGVRLEANVHIVTGAISAAQNIERTVNRAGFRVRDLVLESLAAAEAVLSEDEREVGTLLIDIGGGTTDSLLYYNGSIQATSVIPLGGINITKDISYLIKTPDVTSERLKLQYGSALSEYVNPSENIEIPALAGKPTKLMPRKILAEYIEPRVKEIFTYVKDSIQPTGLLEKLSGGVVITGGTALLEGVLEIAESVFDMEARIGIPKNIAGLKDRVESPIFSTAVGLAEYGLRETRESILDAHPVHPGSDKAVTSNIGNRVKGFLKDIFS